MASRCKNLLAFLCSHIEGDLKSVIQTCIGAFGSEKINVIEKGV